jgi:diguanylate cyclase (GGDEF)-like protein/PAS domain S-box-containing protein
MSDVNYYSIQEASEKLAIPIQKMRRWDEQGVLVAQRSVGGHRRYPRELIDRLAAASENPEAERQFKELATVKKSLAEKHRIIQLLLESEHRYRDLVETSHDLIWATDAQGRFTYLNNATHDIFGLAPKELHGRCFFDFESGDAHISNRRFLSLLRRHGEIKNFLSHLVNAKGEGRWVGINARVLHDETRRMIGIRGTARDITEQHIASERIQHLALHDPLTDLPNRIALDKQIEDGIASGAVGAVVFLDIDHFKYVNDNVGHRAGDQLIRGVGSVLREVVRGGTAQLYRIGGDEFAIHLPEALREAAVDMADRALDAVRHYRFQSTGERMVSNLSASAGIGLYPFHGGDLGTLLANVDIALYQAKDRGRNRHVLFDHNSESLRATHRRVHWSKKLHEALDGDRIMLFAQPVVRLSDQSVVHHEVLLRLKDDDGKIILPASFMETAESLGLIQEFDMRVVEKLLVYMHHNNLMGKRLRYFVNLSRVSISDQHWVKRFVNMLSISKVDPSQLAFEITETAAMTEIDVTLNFIRQLKEMGCRFALDDFGAGFSSFYYLKRFDVDYLKIDGNFIQGLATDNGNQVFVRALNDVARGLNKQVIAEWVETPDVLKILQDMGTQFAQGNLFKPPFPLEGSVPEPGLSIVA